ncbi:MAG: type I restriction enzyme HsdR N-terminal domain-containing protein [Flavobacteriales bacterium]|nr:type I restriction enzyme HsdR N-terminal domain-containing protein [Flavobacteriales bacterium]
MQVLNFSTFEFRFKSSENKTLIFDVIRKKYILLTPEEWVRQHVVHFLINEKGYSQSLINVEKKLAVNGRLKRYDVVVFNSDGSVELLVECKAPVVPVTQDTFDQIARYNMVLNARFLMVTNGIDHYYCSMDFTHKRYNFLREIPSFSKSR